MHFPSSPFQSLTFFELSPTCHEVKMEAPPPTYLSEAQCTLLFQKTLKKLGHPKKLSAKILDKLLVKDALNDFLLSPYFLKLGANPNVKVQHPFSNNRLPLIYSILSLQNLEGSTWLITHKKMQFFYTKASYIISLLHSAILQSQTQTVREILNLKKFPLHRINTPYYSIGIKGKMALRETALSLSTRRFQPEIMQQLLERRATLYQKNPDGENCLVRAVKYGSSARTLRFLFDQKEIALQETASSLLHFLIKNSVMKCEEMIASIDILLENGNSLDTLNDEQNTPLYESVQREVTLPDFKRISEHLIDKGAEVLALYKDGRKLSFSTLILIQRYRLELNGLCPKFLLQVYSLVEEYLLGCSLLAASSLKSL